MFISKNWLKNFVDIPDSLASEQFALDLTMKTVEVEGFKKIGEFLDDVVVGEILKIKKHPNADKLSIAQVDVGEKKPRQIVFGQMVEMEVGFKIPIALAPTTLPGGNKIKKSKIRDEISEGMLCLDQEMDLLQEGVSIRFFEKNVKNGTKVKDVFKLEDVVFNIDNKSMTHRPDLWGHYGMAREVAAIYDTKLKKYNPKEIKRNNKIEIKIKNDEKDLCPRYMAVAIDGIKVEPSPMWMQKQLMTIGVRPINNIVDITNYVMMELGQPMHAFDILRLNPKSKTQNSKEDSNDQIEIEVRKADKGEQFVALDEKEHKLTEDMLVISNAGKAIALAGVIGEERSGIDEETVNIIFESANFDAVSVRRAATKLGIRTESSARFEKSLDPLNCELALRRAVELTLKFCSGAKVASNVADVYDFKKHEPTIILPLEFLQDKMGIEIGRREAGKILQKLGFRVKVKRDKIVVAVPSWRVTKDISIPEDLVEEIARMYGYDNIPADLPKFSIQAPEENSLRQLESKVRELLVYEHSFTETSNYSFVSPQWLRKIGIDNKNHIKLENPIAKDKPLLRRSLIPGLLENIENNLHRFEKVKLFEIGKTFLIEEKGQRVDATGDDLLPRQDVILGMAFAGKGIEVPFYELSEAVHLTLKHLGVEIDFRHAAADSPRYAEIYFDKNKLGDIGELTPKVQEQIGIPYRTALLELNLNQILEFANEEVSYKKIPEYPSIIRDIAFVVDRGVEHAKIAQALKNIDTLITHVELFDVFEGKNVLAGKKSMAYHIEYRSDRKTLKTEEVDTIHTKIENVLKEEFRAEIRS